MMLQVDAALDLSHTQNIGRMIKAHFPHSQVRRRYSIQGNMPHWKCSSTHILDCPMCRCSVAQKALFRGIPDCFTDCFWYLVFIADHLLQFSLCVDVASLLWYHWKKVCSTTPMSSSEQNLWMEFQLWLGLCQLEGRLPQKPQDLLLTKPLKVRFCKELAVTYLKSYYEEESMQSD